DGIRDLNVTGVQTCALPIFKTCGSVWYSICFTGRFIWSFSCGCYTKLISWFSCLTAILNGSTTRTTCRIIFLRYLGMCLKLGRTMSVFWCNKFRNICWTSTSPSIYILTVNSLYEAFNLYLHSRKACLWYVTYRTSCVVKHIIMDNEKFSTISPSNRSIILGPSNERSSPRFNDFSLL